MSEITKNAHYSIDERKRWMDVLARISTEELMDHFRELRPRPRYQLLGFQERGHRGRAEPGLRGGLRGAGERAIRCEVRLASGMSGSACVFGAGRRHAEIAAVFDALLKEPEHYDELIGTVIESIAFNVLGPSQATRRVSDGGEEKVL